MTKFDNGLTGTFFEAIQVKFGGRFDMGLIRSVFIAICFASVAMAEASIATFETDYLSWSIGQNGHTVGLQDRSTGESILLEAAPLSSITYQGTPYPATSAAAAGALLTLGFGDTGVTVALQIDARDTHFVIEVASVTDPRGGVDSLQFLNIPLLLKGTPDESFACSILALNLQTMSPVIPGAMTNLAAYAYRRFGFEGARAAVIGTPRAKLRDVFKVVIEAAEDIPQSSIGGPWALDADINRESYLVALGAGVNESNVEAWIDVAHRTGARQINFHAGRALRFGDYEPNLQYYPNGMEGLKSVVSRLHDAGIRAGLHTYAQFIAKDTPWVTPVPHPDLAYQAVFTLAEDISADAGVISVVESTEDRSAVTGFHVRNSATVRIGEELIVFRGVNKTEPYGFTEVQRGAHNTRTSPHSAGEKVYHLKECFGLFAPDGDSPLYTEVAARTAHVFNTCGFDMMYLDAIDGSDIFAGWENAWHYGAKFVFELASRLEKPALFEMSAFWHHFWYVRSRMGAWDASARGIKPFVDMHAITNRDTQRMYLPSNLGWLAIYRWNSVQPERTFPDHLEYVLGKALAYDSSLSLLVGFDPDAFAKYEHSQRKGEMARTYEQLRLNNEVPEEIRQKLAVLGDEYTLEMAGPTGRQFTPVQYATHTFAAESGGSSSNWKMHNPHNTQPARFRIEALAGLKPYDDPAGITLASFAASHEFVDSDSNDGVQNELTPVQDPSIEGLPTARFQGRSTRAEADTSWTRVSKSFAPYLDLSNRGLGVWIHGDGSGALLNIQIRSPQHLGSGQINRYLDLDFEGWRYVELVEPEGERIVDYEWPEMIRRQDWEKHKGGLMGYAYPSLHIHAYLNQIETVSLFLNNIESGHEVNCYMTPVRALPIEARVLHNPTVIINGDPIVFPIDLPTGHYIEYGSLTDCKVYDSDSTLVAEITPEGAAPSFAAGANTLSFSARESSSNRVRARITTMCNGLPLSF